MNDDTLTVLKVVTGACEQVTANQVIMITALKMVDAIPDGVKKILTDVAEHDMAMCRVLGRTLKMLDEAEASLITIPNRRQHQ